MSATHLLEVADAADALDDFLDGDRINRVAFVGAAVMPLLFSFDLDCCDDTNNRDDRRTFWTPLKKSCVVVRKSFAISKNLRNGQ
jgi:hypothetical protein